MHYSKTIPTAPLPPVRTRILGVKKFHGPELLIRYSQDAHLSFRRKKRLCPADMYIGILGTCAMSEIYRELEHYKPVTQKLFAEFSSGFDLFLVLVGRSKNTITHMTLY